MAEYIEREEAINAVFGAMADGRAVFPALLNLPAADVRPVVRGKWVRKRYGPWASRLKCSECELLFDIATDSPSWNFCPNCGAMMEG